MQDLPKTLTAEAPPPDTPLLRDAALREDVQALIETRARTFLELAPLLRLRRAFYDGAWVVGLHSVREAPSFSRFDVEIRLDQDAGEVVLTCRGTVRARDLTARKTSEPLDEETVDRLRPTVEAWFLEFAERWFDRS